MARQVEEIDELIAHDELHNLMRLARNAVPELDSPDHDDLVVQALVSAPAMAAW